MLCPKCGNSYFKTTNVVNNAIEPKDAIHRDRKCDDCGFIWTTIEVYLDPSGNTRTQTDPYANAEAWSNVTMSEFYHHKKNAIKAAKDLNYGQSIIDRLQEAQTTIEIDQIMNGARHRS